MRSSKNRSRSKGNRNRSVGNIVNRVFDSSGPEGKVRGTPQQIIDKYNQLARDAQLGNDRVAAENFQQHAEHYLRMLAEAQREQEARREQHQQQSGQQGNSRSGDNGPSDDRNAPEQGTRNEGKGLETAIEGSESGSDDSTLVATPESAPKPKRSRTRRPRKQDNDQGGDNPSDAGGEAGGDKDDGGPKEAAE